MTDIQEKVARAIAGICNDKGQELASKCEMQAPPIPWQAFEREAKAAIEAMREPTDEMQRAVYICSMVPPGMTVEHARCLWRAMIGKALEGKQ